MNNKKTTILTVLGILILAAVAVGLTYAYFTAQQGGTTSRDVSVTSNTTDNLAFQISDDISFRVSQADLASGGNNKSGSSTATAVLTPNNKTGAASMNYYLYLKLDTNEIDYCTTNTNNTPELMLTVKDGSNNIVTLTGLGSQTTVKGVTGYDITGVDGVITLLNNHAITASSNNVTTENWVVTITMINLDINQNENTNKEISGELIIRRTEFGYCELNPNDLECQFNVSYHPSVTNTVSLTNGYLYHHDSTLTNGAGDGSYRYSGANPNNYICFGSNASTCPAANLYRIIGLIPVDVVTDETDPNNIVTSNQKLYKIIKNDYITASELGITANNNAVSKSSSYAGPTGNQPTGDVEGFYWNSTSSNTWSTASLNTALNSTTTGYYLASFGTYANNIAKVMWKVGGGDESYIRTSTPMSTVYTNEITESGIHVTNAPTDGKNEIANKVGLMYVSDYGYAAPQTAWSTAPSSYSSVVPNNWMYKGVNEWTVSRNANSYNTSSAFLVFIDGRVVSSAVGGLAHGVRPVLYLTSSTSIDFGSHDGTSGDPFRIS